MTQWLRLYPSSFPSPIFKPVTWRNEIEPDLVPRPAKAVMAAAIVATTGIGFVPPPPPPFVPPNAFSESPQVAVKAFNASQQQVTTFEPRGFIASITPQGGQFTESIQIYLKPFSASLQQTTALTPQGSFLFTRWGWSSESPVLLAKPYNAAQQQFGAWSPRPIPYFFIWGWSSEHPQIRVNPYSAAQQQFTSFPSYGTIISVTPQGWASESPVVLAKPYNASQQQFAAGSPQGSFLFTNWGWASESPNLFVAKFNAAQQQFVAGSPQQLVVAFTNWGWAAESPQVKAQPFGVALQQVTAFGPSGTIVSTTPQGGQFTESPQVRISGYQATLQQDRAGSPQFFAAVFTQWGWASEFPQVSIKPYCAAQQQSTAFPSYGAIFSITPQGWASESPQVVAKSYNADQQQFAAFPSYGTISITRQGGLWSESPQIGVKPYGVAQQQFTAFAPFPAAITIGAGYSDVLITAYSTVLEEYVDWPPNVPTVTPFTNWGWSSESPILLGRTYNAAQQLFDQPFSPLGTIVSFTPQGGLWSESPQVRISPFNAAQQQFTSSFAVRGSFLFTNWGWAAESPIVLGKAFPSYEQIFTTAPSEPLVPTPLFGFAQSPEIYVKGFNWAQQQFAAYPPEGNVPTATTPHGWQPVIYEPYVPPYKAALQQVTMGPVFPYVTAAVVPLVASESPQALVKSYSAALQQFQEFAPQGTIFSVTPQGGLWSESPVILGKPYRAALQQDITSAIQQVPTAATPHGWQYVGYDPFVPPYRVTLQQVTAEPVSVYVSAAAPPLISIPPETIVSNVTVLYDALVGAPYLIPETFSFSESPQLFAPKFNAAQQQFIGTFEPRGFIASITPQGGLWSESPQIIVTKPYRVTLQQDIAAAVQQVPTAVTPHGWQYVGYDPFIPSYKAALQQFSAEPVAPYSSAFLVWGWAAESPVIIGKGYNAAQQLFDLPFTPQGTIVSFTPQGGLWSESPQVLIKAYKAALQQDITAAIQRVPTAATPHGWQPVIWEPIIPAFKAALQQFQENWGQTPPPFVAPPLISIPPETIISNVTVLYDALTGAPFLIPATFGFSESPQAFAPKFNTAQQQFTLWVPEILPTRTPGPLTFSESPQAFAPKFNAAQQQFEGFGPAGILIVVTPGPFGFSPSPDIYLYPNKLGLYPWAMYPPQGNVPTLFVPPGWMAQYPHPIIKGYPAFEQQFSALPMKPYPKAIFHQPKLSATHVTVTFKGEHTKPGLSGTKAAPGMKGEKTAPGLSGTKPVLKIKGDIVDP